MHFNLPENHLFKILIQVCRFFQEFSNFSKPTSLCFLHPKVFDCVNQTCIRNLIPSKCIGPINREKNKDLLMEIGILTEFRIYNLFGEELYLFKSPKKALPQLENPTHNQEKITYGFEIANDLNPVINFPSRILNLKNKNMKNFIINNTLYNSSSMARLSSTSNSNKEFSIQGLEDLDFLIQNSEHYFYKRWLWIIFPWICLHVSDKHTFSSVIKQFHFDSTNYLSSKRLNYFYITKYLFLYILNNLYRIIFNKKFLKKPFLIKLH